MSRDDEPAALRPDGKQEGDDQRSTTLKSTTECVIR